MCLERVSERQFIIQKEMNSEQYVHCLCIEYVMLYLLLGSIIYDFFRQKKKKNETKAEEWEGYREREKYIFK